MLRILVVTNGWGVRTIGGGEYHLLRVLHTWCKKSNVSVIMPKSGYITSGRMLSRLCTVYFSSHEKEVTSLTIEAVSYPGRILRSSIFRLRKYPNVIVASSHLIYDVLPALILRIRLRSKLVIYVHGIFLRNGSTGMWKAIAELSEKISLFLCKKADLIYVINPGIKDALSARGFDTDKIVVTGNGIERDLIDSINVTNKEFDGCFCGRLVEKKGIYDLIDVWERVLKHFPESKLVIIGNGPDYYNLLTMTKMKGLDKSIILTGFVSEERKFSLIKSSRVFISPSYEESWGIAVSEAIACGVVAVCYDLPVYNIYANGIIKLRLGDKEAMAKAITSILDDKNNQVAFAANTRETIANILDWDNISIKELKQINNILDH
jgi:glycosyltransferase involved in cell wall biosynthesis